MPNRGRGRGRGRGGRGGGRGRGRGRGQGQQAQKTPQDEVKEVILDVDKDIKEYFVGTATFDQHYDAQEKNCNRYVAGMIVMQRNGVELSQNARIRALAAAWARRDYVLADYFLKDSDNFGVNEVLKALTLLDSSRRIRFEEKKLKRLHIQQCKPKPKTFGKVKAEINNLTRNKPKIGSASGAICKRLKKWVRQLTKDELEFYALHFPTDPWKKLTDICHFNPKKDFPNLPWFLPFCFGEPAPEESMVYKCREMTAENVNSLIMDNDIPYSHLKKLKSHLSEESKARIARYTAKIDTLLWYYEDLACDAVDEIIQARLADGEQVTLNYGKLMERLLTFKILRGCHKEGSLNGSNKRAMFLDLLVPLAQKQLEGLSLPLEKPIVVVGDASPSMDVAIKTSTIIASYLTAITSAKLVFFDSVNRDAPFIPTNIEEVLKMALTIKTNGATAPAASLYPFYDRKEVVKTFIVVTDEEENSNCEGYRFLPLFKKYHTEVYPARLVFISFLYNQHSQGQMVSALQGEGFPVMQFKLDRAMPDLTKMENLIGQLSSESDTFEEQVKIMEIEVAASRTANSFSQLQLK